jgi:hypothetical protein
MNLEQKFKDKTNCLEREFMQRRKTMEANSQWMEKQADVGKREYERMR